MEDFKSIVGQDLAIQILKSAISKKHIAPAYLFSGPTGVGRKKTAKIFIQSILEKGKNKKITKRKIETNNHTDLLWIEPSYIIQGKVISQKKIKQDNIKIKSHPQIRLDQIKEIIEFLSKKPFESERNIVILEDVERMNESASNALLKTLEEPNDGLFILITNRPEKLLTTIRSRCQIIPFKRLNNFEVDQIIHQYNNIHKEFAITNDKIKELMIFSNGSPGLYLTNLKYWLELPISLREKLNIKLTQEIEALALASEIASELDIEQQLWLINFLQYKIWGEEKNAITIKRLEDLRKQILSYVQPRLAWEVTLLEINFIN